MADSMLINATVCQPAAANTTQLDVMVDPTVTSSGFYLEASFVRAVRSGPKVN